MFAMLSEACILNLQLKYDNKFGEFQGNPHGGRDAIFSTFTRGLCAFIT